MELQTKEQESYTYTVFTIPSLCLVVKMVYVPRFAQLLWLVIFANWKFKQTSAKIIAGVDCNEYGCSRVNTRELISRRVEQPLETNQCDYYVKYVTREDWGGRPATKFTPMATPVDVVYIHQTGFDFCLTPTDCVYESKRNQDFHMDARGWDDIGFNFLVGEDGRVYEGRGWDRVSENILGSKDPFVSIAFMGNFNRRPLHETAYDTLKGLIKCGLARNKLSESFSFRTERDIVPRSHSPGSFLLQYMKQWRHYNNQLSRETRTV